VDRHPAHRLHRIAVKGDRAGKIGYRLDGSGFVVRQHHRYQPRLRPQQGGQCLGPDDAGAVHRQIIDAEADFFQTAQRLGNGRMFDGTGGDVAGRVAGEAEDGEVVRLGAAAGEDHLIGAGAEEGGDALAGVLQRLAGAAAGAVGTGRVAVQVDEVRLHRVPDGGQRRRGGVVVEVDEVHNTFYHRADQAAGGTPFATLHPPVATATVRARRFRGGHSYKSELRSQMMKQTTQRTTAAGVFHNRADAERAVAELKRAGFRDDQISLVGKNADGEVKTEGNKAGTGAAIGAGVGAGVGALASLGMSFGVIPVIGPILAVGPLAAALLTAVGGAAAGGLVGALVGLGIPEHEAKFYEGEVKAGRYLVTVNAANRYDEAWKVLHGLGAYNHETAPAQCATGTARSGAVAGQQSMKLHEEQLQVHKQPVQAGEVKVRKEVVTEHKTIDVPVTREEVVVERHPVAGRAASSADIRPGEEVRIPVREEEVRVEKKPVVKEEVTVGKRQVQETERVGGNVRKEEVRVEKKGDVEVHDRSTTRKDSGSRPDAKR
jgi:uncharacterized protein (TIGR02271 family)